MSLRCRSVALGVLAKTSWPSAHSLSTRCTNSAWADAGGYSWRVMIILAKPSRTARRRSRRYVGYE